MLSVIACKWGIVPLCMDAMVASFLWNWLLLEQGSHLRPDLRVRVMMLLRVALMRISYMQPFFSCMPRSGASLAFVPLQTNPPSPGHAQTDPTAMPTRCSGGTWCCLAREVWDTGEQRLVAVTAARLLPSESLCPSISRQGYFWWPAWSSTSVPMGL